MRTLVGSTEVDILRPCRVTVIPLHSRFTLPYSIVFEGQIPDRVREGRRENRRPKWTPDLRVVRRGRRDHEGRGGSRGDSSVVGIRPGTVRVREGTRATGKEHRVRLPYSGQYVLPTSSSFFSSGGDRTTKNKGGFCLH